MSYSLNQLYTTIGISKQAAHQYAKRQAVFDEQVMRLSLEADELRKSHPGCGVEKMYYTLKPDFIGRDRFIDLFMQLGYKINRKKNYRRTTYSTSLFYPNLIEGMSVSKPSTIWQSDITYIRVGERFYYAVFIIDVYTKKIVGYQVSDHMRATANMQALNMALRNEKPPNIHHSDRGSQYVYKQYIDLLKRKGCKISMGLSAQDNAYAERINRTIKEEYLSYWRPSSLNALKACVKKAVDNYNINRVHKHIGYQTPIEFNNNWALMPASKRPLITIFDKQLNN